MIRQVVFVVAGLIAFDAHAQRTQKPPLHGQEWMAVTGKPLGATAARRPSSGAETRWTRRAR
jgi:gamma-glutamyltranspeptidase/glutathione hydrolase